MPIQFCANLELETIISLLLSRILAASDIARWLQAILAMVIFTIAGRKTLYSSNTTGYELQICSEDVDKSRNVKSSVISKNIFDDLYHLFVWTVTYFLDNDCFGICVVLCCIVFLESLSYVFVESAVKYVDTSLHVYQTMTPGLHITLL